MKRMGFTLIELLIVVAIIAVLAAIAVPNFLEAQTRSKVSRCMADMKSCATALETYRMDHNDLPYGTNIATYLGKWVGLIEFLRWQTDLGTEHGVGFRLTTPISYMSSIPIDVFNTRAFKKQGPHNWVQTGSPEFVKRPVLWASFFIRGATKGNTYMWPHGAMIPYSYILQTTGPDLRPWPENTGAAYNHPFYDPTNGSVSIGDMFYFDKGGFRGGYRR